MGLGVEGVEGVETSGGKDRNVYLVYVTPHWGWRGRTGPFHVLDTPLTPVAGGLSAAASVHSGVLTVHSTTDGGPAPPSPPRCLTPSRVMTAPGLSSIEFGSRLESINSTDPPL